MCKFAIYCTVHKYTNTQKWQCPESAPNECEWAETATEAGFFQGYTVM